MTTQTRFPGWRNMTAAQRYNARMESIFDRAYELTARKAGWSPTGPHGKWVLTGDTHFTQGSYMPTDRACRYICEDHNLMDRSIWLRLSLAMSETGGQNAN